VNKNKFTVELTSEIKSGDFSGLADEYSSNRPDYSNSVLKAIVSLLPRHISKCEITDVGAGTGIWTRMVAGLKPYSVTAIEPNSDMRGTGLRDSGGTEIEWREGSAENTGQKDSSQDWVTMASSFHWANFDVATCEFHRILKPKGVFTALWNPRLIEVNPLLVEIEQKLQDLKPDIKRVSSGKSGITETITDRLIQSKLFDDVVYIEGRHHIKMSKERYLGAWRSVNDLQSQLGQKKFYEFLSFVENKIQSVSEILATYLTRSWSATTIKR